MTEVLNNLRQFHDAVIADLTRHYGDRVATIAAYDPFPDLDGQERRPLDTPALLLEVSAIGPAVEYGTDRLPLRLTCALHCVLSFRTEAVQLELREFAADVLSHIRHQRWGLASAIQEPEALSAQPGEFAPHLAGFDSWQATWEQQVYVGPSTWSGGIAPRAVLVGGMPLTGAVDG